ncbi:hypothetical protein A3726_02885 [Erythrobacter sp. HI0037]|uniref:hypothetical protein n=1 Tax=Qipengyuania flava TaxID=192812 RepID=UPI0007C3FDE8|nr:hypothetical protein [Qipengyuania flava]ASP31251.1 hypothetical protein CHH26_14170 [Qipengyuania flava]KZY28895.1 hypothetical protein A3726_02885 [Erythrobacter sp. HI0037]
MSRPIPFPRPPIRAIELRQVNTGDRWQAIYAGDEWTREFVSTVATKAFAIETFQKYGNGLGLPIIIMPGYFEEVAA